MRETVALFTDKISPHSRGEYSFIVPPSTFVCCFVRFIRAILLQVTRNPQDKNLGFNSKALQSENDLSCDPPAIDRGMQQLIDHTVEQWLRVDEFLKLYRNPKKRATLKEAAKMMQTAAWGLKPLVDYDGRLPNIIGLGSFAEWVNNLYSPGGPPPRIAMCCCAEQIARYFKHNTGDLHWPEVAKIVLEKFHHEKIEDKKAGEYKNPGRWIRKQRKAFHRLWDKGDHAWNDFLKRPLLIKAFHRPCDKRDGKPPRPPIVERTLFLSPESYYKTQNRRRKEQQRLQSKIFELAGRENLLLTKALNAGQRRGQLILKTQNHRQRAIVAARKKSPTLGRLSQDMLKLQAQLVEARKRWSDEDAMEAGKDSARLAYHRRRAIILDTKKKPRKRSLSNSAIAS